MLPITILNPESDSPLYRQLHSQIRDLIQSGRLTKGGRLPATRELAGQLGLNRTTISAAYELLEEAGLITGHVGRGSFVAGAGAKPQRVRWHDLLEPSTSASHSAPDSPSMISFSSSRPSELLFPLEKFRATCREVIESRDAQTSLQLGSPGGYALLRRYLLDRARAAGVARSSDDILITNGCQQAFDLLQRTLVAHGETVLLEDPVYLGVKNAFARGGARLIGIPVGEGGIDLDHLERVIGEERPRLLVVTS